ncbi:MAG: TonB-dependent receptor [Bacteroidota bacterium]
MTSIIEVLQDRFDVNFNYASALVEGIELAPPTEDLDLAQTLAYLNTNCPLDFELLSDTFVSVKEKLVTICGVVKDRDTKEVLPFVAVQHLDQGTLADEEGKFKLEEIRRGDVIEIRLMGYKPFAIVIKDVNDTSCKTYLLTPYQEELSEVTVVDYLVRGMDQLENGAVSIDLDRFKILPGLVEDDVLQSVQALPGIISIDETVSNLNIRGGSNDQNLISWDGIKMYQSGHFFGLISMYNPDITQKVILQKNGSRASDTDGVSGSIFMKTEEYLNTKLKGSVGVNLIDTNAYIDAPLGKRASLQVAARKALSDFLETPTYARYFDRIVQETEITQNAINVTNSDISFDFYDASMRLLYQPSFKDRIRANFMYTSNAVVFDETAEVMGELEVRQSDLSQTTLAAGLTHQREWTKNFTSELAIHNTIYSLKSTNADILLDQRFVQENKVEESALKVKTTNKLTQQLTLTSGYDLIETKITNIDDVDNPLFVEIDGRVLRTHAGYTELGMTSSEKRTNLILGLRYNYLERFKKHLWEPRLSFNHNFWEHFSVELLGEFKHQGTSQIINFQNDFLGIERRRWQLSNDDDIPVITSQQGSLGLTFNDKGWLVSAVGFYKDIQGITSQSQGFQNQFEFSRAPGNYDAHGAELLFRRQFRNNSIWASYSYLRSRYSFEELQDGPFTSNYDVTHALTVGTNYSIGKLLLAGGLNWRRGRPLTLPIPEDPVVDGDINFGPPNSEREEEYLRVDISGKYEFDWGKKRRIQVGLAIWNVLDRRNNLNTFYRPNALGEAQAFMQNSLAITPNASIRMIF